MTIQDDKALVELVEEVRGIFDWKQWTREQFQQELAEANPTAPVVELSASDSEDSDSANEEPDPDAMVIEKVVKRRKRYTIKQKIRILDTYPQVLTALAKKFRRPETSFTKKDVLTVISRSGGYKYQTIVKFFWEEDDIRKKNEVAVNRRRFTFGSGQHASFPKTETALREEVGLKRGKSHTVTFEWIMQRYKELANSENSVLAGTTKFGEDIFYAFLRRKGLARRKPSNIKPMTVADSMRAFRGFHQYLIKILKGDIPIAIGSKEPTIHPIWGRFPLDCRVNKDEVPGVFGDPSRKIISIRGESSTKVVMLEGWGDRIATLVMTLTSDGKLLTIVIIFKGRGKRVAKDESAKYDTLSSIKVLWQPKAWNDGATEQKIVGLVLVPYAKKMRQEYLQRGEKFPGILDVEDNFSAHLNAYFLIIISVFI